MVDGYYLRECIVSIPLAYCIFNLGGNVMKYVLSLTVAIFLTAILAVIVLFASETVKIILALVAAFSMFLVLIHILIWGLQ